MTKPFSPAGVTPPWAVHGAEEKLPYTPPAIYPISPEITRTWREDLITERLEALNAELTASINELKDELHRRLTAVEARTPGIGFNESSRM